MHTTMYLIRFLLNIPIFMSIYHMMHFNVQISYNCLIANLIVLKYNLILIFMNLND